MSALEDAVRRRGRGYDNGKWVVEVVFDAHMARLVLVREWLSGRRRHALSNGVTDEWTAVSHPCATARPTGTGELVGDLLAGALQAHGAEWMVGEETSTAVEEVAVVTFCADAGVRMGEKAPESVAL